MEVDGLVQVSRRKTIIEKSSENSTIPVLIFWSSVLCVPGMLFVDTLLKLFSYYDL